MMDVRALLVGNAQAISGKAMGEVLGRLRPYFAAGTVSYDQITAEDSQRLPPELMRQWQGRSIRLAVPDGHQKTPAVELLQRAGVEAAGYPGRTVERRLLGADEWLAVKVIRPQDMPLQVACGHFDVAITGQDWLHEHRISFPGSPVTDLVDLGFGKVRIVAALSESIPVNSTSELRRYLLEHNVQSLRVASEYTNIADKYLRENHIRSYRVMPTWGSSEAFLPDDADLLVDNTQTGKTLVENGLKIIEVIYRSSACLIANTLSLQDPAKRPLIDGLASRLAGAVQ
jgi:ATP phosphoribosyltransferase